MTISTSAEISVKMLVSEHFELFTTFKKKVLLSVAQNINPKRVLSVKRGLEKENQKYQQDISLEDLSSSEILDYLYGVDLVLKTENLNGEEVMIAIDVTTNSTQINFKIEKMEKLKSMLQAIGIDSCLVVHWENEKTYTQMFKTERYELASKMLDSVDNSSEWSSVLYL